MSTSTPPTPERARSIHAQARASGIPVPGNRGVKVVQSCTILKPATELYAFLRNLDNLPRVVKHSIQILPLDGQDTNWWISARVDGDWIEWNAAIINDEPGRLIAWQSLRGAPVPNAGTVRFDPLADGTGTEVTVQLEYDAPGGKLAHFFARLTGEEPVQQVAEALRRFKTLAEADAIPVSRSWPGVGERVGRQ